MEWISLVLAGLVVWALCGAVMALGPHMWSMRTTLRVHLAAAPLFSFVLSLTHVGYAPEIFPVLRAALITLIIVLLDAAVAAPLFERSYSMFRSVIGTWIPFLLIFLASWAAGSMI